MLHSCFQLSKTSTISSTWYHSLHSWGEEYNIMLNYLLPASQLHLRQATLYVPLDVLCDILNPLPHLQFQLSKTSTFHSTWHPSLHSSLHFNLLSHLNFSLRNSPSSTVQGEWCTCRSLSKFVITFSTAASCVLSHMSFCERPIKVCVHGLNST